MVEQMWIVSPWSDAELLTPWSDAQLLTPWSAAELLTTLSDAELLTPWSDVVLVDPQQYVAYYGQIWIVAPLSDVDASSMVRCKSTIVRSYVLLKTQLVGARCM
eukprot:GHVU01062159.1.p1 GENE.GHVU01062159.1~~GHVU01062159.1.p1  ORF type:complete len:104 (-),score=0.07 GHVU01062159.1:627-938(-)